MRSVQTKRAEGQISLPPQWNQELFDMIYWFKRQKFTMFNPFFVPNITGRAERFRAQGAQLSLQSLQHVRLVIHK